MKAIPQELRDHVAKMSDQELSDTLMLARAYEKHYEDEAIVARCIVIAQACVQEAGNQVAAEYLETIER